MDGTISITNTWTTITSDNKDVLDLADEVTSYTQKNWERARAEMLNQMQRSGQTGSSKYQWALNWDGRRPIGVRRRNAIMIPSGCLSLFMQVAYQDGFNTFAIENNRRGFQVLDIDWRLKPNKEPRPYQNEAIDTFIRSKSRRGIIKSPTGSGKTYMMAMLISQLKTTTLIKVPNITLLKQIRSELLDSLHINENHIGLIGDGNYDPSLITIVTRDSLSNIYDDNQRWYDLMGMHAGFGWGLLIEDEVQQAATDTSFKTSMALDIYNRIGFSATPLKRSDNKNIMTIGAFGDIIYEIDASWLIENDFLVKPTVKFINLRPVPLRPRATWNDVYDAAIVYNNERNDKILDLAREMERDGRHTLIFVDRIEHGNLLHNMTADSSHPIPFIHGESEDREEVIEKFKAGIYPTLIATQGIIGVGFDYPELDALIMGDGKKSFINTMQKTGRGMRIFQGKEDLLLFDFGDSGTYVTDHARERISIWRKAGFEIDLSETPYLM